MKRSKKNRKNSYILFFSNCIVFFLIIFLLDYCIGNVLRYFYFKQDNGLLFRTTYSIDKTKADILIFGASRANHHYQPDIFEKRLNLSFYNTGRDGNFIFYQYAVLESILKRYHPKIVILDFMWGEFIKDQEKYDRISSLLPYYKSHPEIRPIIELKTPYEKLKLLSSIYPFNSLLFTIGVGNMEFNKKRKGDNQGYVPLTHKWNESIQVSDNSSKMTAVDSIEIKLYESFIHHCVDSNVKVCIICSPYFIKFNYEDYSIKIGQEIAKKYNVLFLDYSNASMFNDPALFNDPAHLNDKGAKIFSNMLVDTLIKTIKN